jgi:hypothetical protein
MKDKEFLIIDMIVQSDKPLEREAAGPAANIVATQHPRVQLPWNCSDME